MVERTAHNGLVAGSNPAEPTKFNFYNKMNKNLKTYKLYKVKTFLKRYPIIIIYHTLNVKEVNWLKINESLEQLNLKCYKLRNKLSKHALKNSVFSNFSVMLNGSLCFVYPKNATKFNGNFKTFSKINKIMPILAIKINKKIYSTTQLSSLSTLNYKSNISTLNLTLKKIIKTPYYKFKT